MLYNCYYLLLCIRCTFVYSGFAQFALGICTCIVAFWMVGYGIAFSRSGIFLGFETQLFAIHDLRLQLLPHFLHQLCIVLCAYTFAMSAWVERTSTWVFVSFAPVFVCLIYSPIAHCKIKVTLLQIDLFIHLLLSVAVGRPFLPQVGVFYFSF